MATLSPLASRFIPQPSTTAKTGIGSCIAIVHLTLAAKIHTHIVKARVTATNPDPLAKIAASHMSSTRLVGIKNKVALLAVVERGIKV